MEDNLYILDSYFIKKAFSLEIHPRTFIDADYVISVMGEHSRRFYSFDFNTSTKELLFIPSKTFHREAVLIKYTNLKKLRKEKLNNLNKLNESR